MGDFVQVFIGAPDAQTAVSLSSADRIHVSIAAGFTGSGSGGGGATNLTTTRTATTVTVTSDTGTDATIPAADGSNAGVMTAAMQSKLAGIEAGADVTDTANVDAAGAVMNSDYNQAHSVLVQQSGSGTPVTVNLGNNTILGKSGGGDVAALTATQVRSLINVEDGADVTDAANVGSVLNAATAKTTPVDADTIPLSDSAASGGLKKLSWANLKATAKAYFDTIYQAALGFTPANKAGDTFTGNISAPNLSGNNTGDQTITLTGDVTGSGTGSFAATIANDAVTFAKMQNSAADGLSVIGRSTNSAGDFAEINAGTDGHVLRRSGTAVGFGTLASGAFASNTVSRAALANATALSVIGRSANSSGAPADIAAANDGEVLRRSGTTLGFGTIATAGIADNAVTNAKLADMATATIKGRTTAGTGDPEDLTAAQATALLDTFTSSLKGLAPASGGGTTNFLRADGTWAAPAGGGLSDGDKGDITVSSSGTVWTIDNDAVSYAKIQNVSTNNRLLGRATSGAGDIEEITIGSGLSMSGTTLSATGGGGGGDLTVLNVNNTQVQLSNTTSETALFSFNLPTDLAAGETLILELAGQYRNDVSTNPTWTPRIKLGGNTIMQRAATFGNSTTRSWLLRCVINIVSTSSQKVSIISHHVGDGPGALANTLISGVAMHFAGYDTASEDTTTTKALEFTMQISAASASSWIYCEMATLYRLSAP